MNAILLDTNAYAAFKRGDADSIEILRNVPSIAVSVVVLGELVGGFAAGSREADNRRELSAFLGLPKVRVLPIGHATAEHYASLYARLRAAGTPIPSNDLWLAATAIEHTLHLFSFDRHFRFVPGLTAGSTPAECGLP